MELAVQGGLVADDQGQLGFVDWCEGGVGLAVVFKGEVFQVLDAAKSPGDTDQLFGKDFLYRVFRGEGLVDGRGELDQLVAGFAQFCNGIYSGGK